MSLARFLWRAFFKVWRLAARELAVTQLAFPLRRLEIY
jgi:hypothetical protein